MPTPKRKPRRRATPPSRTSRLARARREHGVEGVRALLVEVFAQCETASDACDALEMPRFERRGLMIAPVSALRLSARRAGVEWPYTRRGRPPA